MNKTDELILKLRSASGLKEQVALMFSAAMEIERLRKENQEIAKILRKQDKKSATKWAAGIEIEEDGAKLYRYSKRSRK